MAAIPVSATQMMGAAGFSWDDVLVQAQHVVHLLQTEGDTALAIVTGTLKLVRYIAARDMLNVFAQLNATTVDVQALIAAIKAEFGLN